jgi:amino acid transporter
MEPDSEAARGLERALGLPAATALNVLSMVGAGPFITIPLLLDAMHGPQAMVGWLLGAAVALCDGLVWAELGSAMPAAGGAWRFLLDGHGAEGGGRPASFLYLWQVMIVSPLIFASGAVGFANYARYLAPGLSPAAGTALAMTVCLLATALAHRRIAAAGRFGVAFGALVLAIVAWIVAVGVSHGRAATILAGASFTPVQGFWGGLGAATLYAMYDYIGYQAVCSVGAEVRDPSRTLPRAIVLSVVLVGALYVAMNLAVLSVVPWQDALRSSNVVSDFFARIYGRAAAVAVTCAILAIIFAGLFAGFVSTARVSYAAARDGRFYPAFGRLDRTGHFPGVAVLYVGLSSTACCLFALDALINVGMVIYVLVQCIPVVLAVPRLRARARGKAPGTTFRMPAYPLPVIVALAGWIYIVATSGAAYLAAGVAATALGIGAYAWRTRIAARSPPAVD